MFVLVYRSSSGYKYMKIVQSVRTGRSVRHRYLESLGRFDETKYEMFRKIIRQWRPLIRSKIVLQELKEKSGCLQGRGFFRSFKQW